MTDGVIGCAGARAVVGGDHGAVGQCDWGDLALIEAVSDGGLCAVLGSNGLPVLLLAADAGDLGNVLRGLTHRDIGIRE